jgi:hypothetical protein
MLRWFNAVHSLIPYFSEVHFNLALLPSRIGLPNTVCEGSI